MIQINLLPQQYRQKQRPPLKALSAVAGIATVNASLAAWLGWLHFTVAAAAESELAVVKDSWSSVEPQTKYHDALQAESKQYTSRESTLADMTATRVSWTSKVDLLVDVIHDGSEQGKYTIWLDDLSATQSSGGKRKSAGSLKATGHCGGDNVALIANFLDDLQASPFIEGFEPPKPVQGTQSDLDVSLIPSREWRFPLDLAMKQPEAPKAPAKKPSSKKSSAKEKEQ